jgi:hypothetical protein
MNLEDLATACGVTETPECSSPDSLSPSPLHAEFTVALLPPLVGESLTNSSPLYVAPEHNCSHRGCKFAAESRELLSAHFKQKHARKTHQCPHCEYSTTTFYDIRKHIRKHTGEKPYKCTHCSYASAQSSALHKHIKNKHTPKTPAQPALDLNTLAALTQQKMFMDVLNNLQVLAPLIQGLNMLKPLGMLLNQPLSNTMQLPLAGNSLFTQLAQVPQQVNQPQQQPELNVNVLSQLNQLVSMSTQG